jgi:hypothetical protein
MKGWQRLLRYPFLYTCCPTCIMNDGWYTSYTRASPSVLISGHFLRLNCYLFDFGDCVCVRVCLYLSESVW